jgi:hypothetical protein
MGAPLYDYAVRLPQMIKRPGSRIAGTALFTEGLDTTPSPSTSTPRWPGTKILST